ncbi:MAG: FkbM family methyltransferase [Desulfuromonadaceae bacterium]
MPKHARGYYSQLGQDEIVERYFAAHLPKGRVFVEVGAFDGVHYSNVRRLRETHGWSGVSIEPVGQNFEKLVKSYAGQPVACVRCAVGEKEGVAELNVSSYPHLPDWGSDVATFRESETQRWQQAYGAVWHKEQVPVKTLTSVLQENNIGVIDFLSVDAEGHDLDVLKGLDFSIYKPQLIVVEYNRHRQEIFDFLVGNGYRLFMDNGQDLFMELAVESNFSGSGSILISASVDDIPQELEHRDRVLKTLSCHDCDDIPKVPGAGRVIAGNPPRQLLHNGIEILHGAFHGEWMSEIIKRLRGHHEPQEEKVFHEVLKAIPPNAAMLELGSFWAYYSMWFNKSVTNARNYMIEPNPEKFELGQKHFRLNNMTGVFTRAFICQHSLQKSTFEDWDHKAYTIPQFCVDDYLDAHGIEFLHLLHSDIQGAEYEMLLGCRRAIATSRIGYVFISTHGECHDKCLAFLREHGFTIIASHTIEESYSADGLIVAASPNVPRIPPVSISGFGRQPAAGSGRSTMIADIRDKLNPHLLTLGTLPLDKPIRRVSTNPKDLLTCARFDIIPKFTYAEYREFGIDSPWGRGLYEAHLLAFNGCQEGDGSGKTGIGAFIASYETLLDSVRSAGFDPSRSLVPVDQNGVVIDGAHRVAACLLYSRPVDVLEFELQTNKYNYEYFLNKGLDVDYCDAIALEYCRLNPRAHIVSVFPSAVGRELEIREILERNGEIFYARQVQLSRLGSVNLVRQMYDGEHWVGSFANRFEGAQNKAAECFRTDGPVRVYVFTSDDFEKVKAAKQQIRDLFDISNHSVHINDTHAEAVRLGQLLFNANSIHFLNNAQLTTFPRFQAHFNNYKKVLREQGVDGECLCIDGSAVMAAYGIREARDLDYLHFGYDDLVFDYPPELIGSHNAEIAHHVTTRDDIIFNPRNHFYYDGVKFASLGIIRAMKEKRGEPKDFEDIALIDQFVATPLAPPHVHRSGAPAPGAGQAAGAGRQPKIVGLVPARNEKYTIAQCLRALSLLTDAIVYLDDASTDETPDIVASLASQCRIERIIRKKEWHRDEPGDRNTMLLAGREIGGTHFIIIDADEMLTANLLSSPGLRDAILQLQPGDRLALNWIQLWRSIEQYRFDQSVWTWNYKDIIFCDDGRCSYSSEFIHTPRVPGSLSGNRYTIEGYEAGLLHFQFVNWRNLLVKQAWYRCLEHNRESEKPVTEINERYAPSKDESGLGLAPSPAAWFSGYPFFDRTVYDRPDEWREEQILGWFRQYGREHFAGLDIWDVAWAAPSSVQVSSAQASVKQVLVFQESRLAHQLLDGLKGLEIGASAHNPFGLNTRNVGLYIDGYIHEQMGYCGRAVAIDIEAPAHAIPLPDESEDFIVSSHVVEHCPDLIRSFLEWFRIVRPGGYLFMIVPHRNASSADVGRPLTDWTHVCEDFRKDVSATTEADPKVYANQHCHVFAPETLKGFIAATFGDRLELVAEQQIDDKVGNGFTLAYRKARPLAAAYPWSVQAAEGGNLEMPHLASHSMNPYRVTAVVSTYRSEAFMRGCLEDLVNQALHRRGELEIIVIDSASPENEGVIVREFQQRSPHIRYIRTDERETIYQAWNRGCRAARGQYVTNANTDDRHREDALEVMARELDAHTETALVYGDVFVTGLPNQIFAGHVRCGYYQRPDYAPEIMLSGCHMGPQPMWRRDVHETIGWFDDQLRSAGDFEFWCRIALRYSMRHIPEFLGLYFENPAGICNSAMDVSQHETEEVFRRYAGKLPPPPRSFTTNLQFRGTVTETGYVNIGMITFNRLDFTRQAIDALLFHTDHPYTLTVVDNNSQDGTREYLLFQKQKGIIKNLVLLDENVGIAKASNLAWSLEPKADYYLKLDNDIIIRKKGWLTAMVEIIDRLPQVGAVAYNFEPTSYPIQTINGCRIRIKPQGNLGGACILIPMRTHEKLGFWCEDYGLYGEEDYDYGIRIRLAGLENAYMEDEEIGFHLPAGRAAIIDACTFRAHDGVEEKLDADYRAQKDQARRKIMRTGILKRNINEYKNNAHTLFTVSTFVAAWSGQDVLSAVRPLNITVFTMDHQKHACVYYRILSPLCSQQSNVEISWGFGLRDNQYYIEPDAIKSADLFVVQRSCPRQETTVVLDYLFTLGKPIVYEIDDLLTQLPPKNPWYDLGRSCAPNICDFVKKCSAVTVSTEELKTQFSALNENIYVLPNLINADLWCKKSPTSSGPLVIGYAGTVTHEADLELIEEVLERVALRYGDKVAFTFMGCATERIAKLSGFAFVKFEETFEAYAKILQEISIDIMLIPLEDNPFNRCKSNIKWLEYSACGIAGIYTDLPPYNTCIKNGETGLLVCNSVEQWFEAICLLIEHPDQRQKMAEAAREEVLTTFSLQHSAQRWEQVYRAIIENHQVSVQCQSVESIHSKAADNQSTVPEMSVPAVSIIIPVFNKCELTQQCLQSLFATLPHKITCEVIIVDNGSSDETANYLKTLGDQVRVVSNTTNLGFAKACNQGAQAAAGKNMLFLNNDTEPQQAWLEPMLDMLESDASIGAVGSKLLFPDGTIQHAGVLVLEDQKMPDLLFARHVFYGQSADLPDANRTMAYQVLTAACLLVRAEAFRQVDGFDEGYWNGYEDVDLCFKLREQGWQLTYQPASVVIHHESKSGKERFAKVSHNIQRLHDKWLGNVRPDAVIDPQGGWHWIQDDATWRSLTQTAPCAAGRQSVAEKTEVTGLVTIVILTFNQLWCTKECVESIQQHTPEIHAIIFVDNGSTDGTVAWLLEQVAQHDNYRLIENGTNLGFAKGCNQGIEAAGGEYILLLNNDVVVTEGWLTGLLECHQRRSNIGIVGPMTNNISGIQRVADVGYDNVAGLDAFARSFRDRNRYWMIENRRIVGFCMLFSKQLADEVGLLDETFGSGNFEDDDYCLRAELAGYRNYIAGDVFIHHYGSQTFDGNKMDYGQAMQGNMALYRQKWNYKQLDEGVLRRLIPLDAVVESRRLAQLGDIDKAVDTLMQKGIRAAPDNHAPYLELTELLIREGRFRDALEVLPEMPPDVDPLLKNQLAAVCQCALGDGVAAHHAALQATGRPKVQMVLGALAARQGELAEAECLFRQAVQADPSCGNGWLSLGMLQWGSGHQESAYQAVRRAVVVDPLNDAAVRMLRDMAGRIHHHEDACQAISMAAQLYPDSRNLARHHAELLAQCGLGREALNACEAFLVRFGVDEDMLGLALQMRRNIGVFDRLSESGTRSISLCMIVKNEEMNLPACLASLKPVVDEMIIVDTGSTDRTIDIATVFGTRVLSFPWNGNFSDARNVSLAAARGSWILVMDADEVLSAQDHEQLRQAVQMGTEQRVCWNVMTRNYTRLHPQGWIANDGSYPCEERAEGWHPSRKVRLFPNDARVRFQGEVHEMVDGAAEQAGYRITEAHFVVHHYGGLVDQQGGPTPKQLAYFELGLQKLTEHPEDVGAIGELAVQAAEIGRYDEAVSLWDRFLVLRPDAVIALFNKGFVLMLLHRYAEALVVSQRALELEPNHREAAFNYSLCELYAGDPERALGLVRPVAGRNPEHPLLQALFAVLCFACNSLTEGREKVSLLKESEFNIEAYIAERASALDACGRKNMAARLRQQSGINL